MSPRFPLHAAATAGAAAGFLVLAATFNVGAQSSGPQMLVPRLDVRTVVSGLTMPIGLAFLGPNDMLVLEKDSGQVKRVVNGSVTGTVLDLGVNRASERGLLGIALHPDFPANPGVYLFWTCRSTALPADPFFPDERTCLDANMFAADSGEVLEVPLLGNRVDRFIWNGSALTFDRNLIMLRAFQNDGAPTPPGQGDESQPPRGNHNGGVTSLRSRPEAVRADGRQRPARSVAEPARRSTRSGTVRRPVRRPRAGRRASDRRDPAAQRRWQHACRQSVLQRRRAARRRGRRKHPEDLRLRPTQRLRHGLRSQVGAALGAGERRRCVQRAESRGARIQLGLGADHGTPERLAPVQGDRDDGDAESTGSLCATRTSACSSFAGRRPTSPIRPPRRWPACSCCPARITARRSSRGNSRSRPAAIGFVDGRGIGPQFDGDCSSPRARPFLEGRPPVPFRAYGKPPNA